MNFLPPALNSAGIGPDGSVNRASFSEADLECRAWFAARAQELALTFEVDRNGNQWAWWEDHLSGTALVMGSHLDSVPDGGRWDGPLGVVAAFAAVEELRARGFTPTRPIAVVNFMEEEGGRFGLACLGSRLMTGAVDGSRALALADRDGVTLRRAMVAAGLDASRVGADPDRVRRIGAFVEPHIEQGHLPVADAAGTVRGLAAAGAPLGVLTEIWAHGRWRIDIPGTPNHAGTTALDDRDDPVLAMARGILLVREVAQELGVLATVGKVSVVPGAVNAIASLATMWVDARGANAEKVPEVAERVASALESSAILESWTPATRFDGALSDALAAAAQRASGVPAPRLPSGAGHDSGVLAEAGVPAAMLAVRNLDGTSHAAAEHADDADAFHAVTTLVELVAALS